jgi:hypothetical protein
MKKRMVVLSGAFVLLGGIHAAWLGLQRRIRAQEQSLKLQVWEAEGGSRRETTSESNPADARLLKLTPERTVGAEHRL